MTSSRVRRFDPDAFVARLVDAQPTWMRGSLSRSDARFLFRCALESRCEVAVEIGTGSGFSATLICHALRFAREAGSIADDFRVVSYDVSRTVFGIPTKRVGDAAREILPADLLAHIEFRNPAIAVDIAEHFSSDTIGFLFIDGNHRHPWPALDLLATLDVLRPGALVLLHDINLPLRHPEHADWGANHLFADLELEKKAPTDDALPNIGSITIPPDKEELRKRLREIVHAHPWQGEIPERVLLRTLATPGAR